MFVLLFAPVGIDATSAVSIALVLRCAELAQIILFSFIWVLPPGKPPAASADEPEINGNQLPLLDHRH
jgi:hypothetical protein